MKAISLLLLISMAALATEPCPPDSWSSNPKRSSSDWKARASWIAAPSEKDGKKDQDLWR